MIYFAQYKFLLLLLLVPVILIVHAVKLRLRRKRVERFGDAALVEELMKRAEDFAVEAADLDILKLYRISIINEVCNRFSVQYYRATGERNIIYPFHNNVCKETQCL